MAAYWLLVLHLVGDYLLQSDWMALQKTKNWWPAVAHVLVYTLPFGFLFHWQLAPLLLIGGTHLVIDHYRLARYVCWAKNFLAPRNSGDEAFTNKPFQQWWHPWSECSVTGYHQSRPDWLVVWLLFIADNTLHLLFNGLAWAVWGS